VDIRWAAPDHCTLTARSTSLLSTISGTLVMSSTTRFRPFGEYRVEPEARLTDKGFTGHAHNDDVGLIFLADIHKRDPSANENLYPWPRSGRAELDTLKPIDIE
jgi:hypothetical protein